MADYDEAFAAYTDARRRFNELKLARAYLPIVALSDPSAGNLTPGLAAPPQQLPHVKGKKGGFGFGKGKGGRGKKGKGSGTTVRYQRGPGKERDPRGRASAAMKTCLRCGQLGHTTSDCPICLDPPRIHLRSVLQLHSLWSQWLLDVSLVWSSFKISMAMNVLTARCLTQGHLPFSVDLVLYVATWSTLGRWATPWKRLSS